MLRAASSLAAAVALLSLSLSAAPLAAQSAAAIVSRATDRLGGAARLDSLYRVRMAYQTLWYRPRFLATASGLSSFSSAEENVDTRDYRANSWRSERRYGSMDGPAQVINIVADSVASTWFGSGVIPQNAAYVTERIELFLTTPSWLFRRLAQLDGADAPARGRDTVIAGRQHYAVNARVSERPVTLWITPDGWLTGLRFVGAQPKDFGLAGFGEMEVRVFYELWRSTSGIVSPWFVSVFREGELYKQLLLRRVDWMPELDVATFAIPDSTRDAFLAKRTRAMQDVPHDSLVPAHDGVVGFFGAFTHPGAVRLRDGWMLIGAGPSDIQVELAAARLEREGAPLLGAFVFSTSPTVTGGLPALMRRGGTVLLPAESEGVARVVLESRASRTLRTIRDGSWHTIGGDSVWMEPIIAPDAAGAMLVYVPRLRWAYFAGVGGGAPLIAAQELLTARRFTPTHVGSAQGLARLVTAPRQQP